MTNSIVFRNIHEEDFERDGIIFPADFENNTIQCLITIEAIMENFHSSRDDHVDIFLQNRKTIEEIARTMINLSKFKNNELLIKSKDIQLYST